MLQNCLLTGQNICLVFVGNDKVLDATNIVINKIESEIVKKIRQLSPGYLMMGALGKKTALNLIKGGNSCEIL